jgi:hypothetical protein
MTEYYQLWVNDEECPEWRFLDEKDNLIEACDRRQKFLLSHSGKYYHGIKIRCQIRKVSIVDTRETWAS